MSEQVDHIVVALLAVGGYPLQRVWDCLPALQKAELTDPEAARLFDEAEVVRRLARAGYDRGPIVTNSMAQRLSNLYQAIHDGVLEQALGLMQKGRLHEAEKLLCQVKGVGPAVFRQFAMLEGVAK